MGRWIQEAVPQPETGLDQGRPRLGPAHAVDAQPRRYWNPSTAAFGAGPEDAVGVRSRGQLGAERC